MKAYIGGCMVCADRSYRSFKR